MQNIEAIRNILIIIVGIGVFVSFIILKNKVVYSSRLISVTSLVLLVFTKVLEYCKMANTLGIIVSLSIMLILVLWGFRYIKLIAVADTYKKIYKRNI